MTKSKVFERINEYFNMLIANNMDMQHILVNGELMKMMDFIGYLWNLDDKGLYKLSLKITRDSDIGIITCMRIDQDKSINCSERRVEDV